MDSQQEWVRIEIVDGQERYITFDDRHLNQFVPMTYEKAVQQVMRDAWQQEKLIQKVDAIPERLRNEFIPKIKNIRREVAKVATDGSAHVGGRILASGIDFSAEGGNKEARQAFREQNPQLDEAFAEFGKRNQALQLEEKGLKDIFCNEEWKGMPEQFDTLVQAIIEHIFSKDRRHYPPLPPDYTFPYTPNQTPSPGS